MAKQKSKLNKFTFGKSGKLTDFETEIAPLYSNDDEYDEKFDAVKDELGDLQDVLYADARYGVLLIFQGMDTSGKDGAIKRIMSCFNPMGVQVSAFSSPTLEERRHDFLWRTHVKMPSRGKIAAFNRSYYEEVTTVRVHPEFLDGQSLPPEHRKGDRIWTDRLEDIVGHELYLYRQGYRIIKFFLHLSKGEQKKRLLSRIDEPKKNWKFDPSDIKARGSWARYQKAYDECLKATSRPEAPWYVIPADDKKNARLLMAEIVRDELASLPLKYPSVSAEQKRELEHARKILMESSR